MSLKLSVGLHALHIFLWRFHTCIFSFTVFKWHCVCVHVMCVFIHSMNIDLKMNGSVFQVWYHYTWMFKRKLDFRMYLCFCLLYMSKIIDTLHIVWYHVKITTSLSVSTVVFSPIVFHWFSLFCCFHLFVLDFAQLYCPVYLCFQAIVNHVVIFVFVLVLYHNLSFLVVFMCRKKGCHFLV